MRKKLTIKALAIVLSVLWIFSVYLVFYRTQKPFTVETFLAYADSLLDIALTLFILLLGTAWGATQKTFASPYQRAMSEFGRSW